MSGRAVVTTSIGGAGRAATSAGVSRIRRNGPWVSGRSPVTGPPTRMGAGSSAPASACAVPVTSSRATGTPSASSSTARPPVETASASSPGTVSAIGRIAPASPGRLNPPVTIPASTSSTRSSAAPSTWTDGSDASSSGRTPTLRATASATTCATTWSEVRPSSGGPRSAWVDSSIAVCSMVWVGSASVAGRDHPGADGAVGRLVDQDEAAGGAVAASTRRHSSGWVVRSRTRPISLSPSSSAASSRCSVLTSSRYCRSLTSARAAAGRVLDRVASARLAATRLVHPADHRVDVLGDQRLVVRPADHVAAGDVDLVLEPDRHRHRRVRLVDRAVGRCRSTRSVEVNPEGSTMTSSPGLSTPPATWPA